MSPVILNAQRVYLSRTAVDFHRVQESFRRVGVGVRQATLAALAANEV